MFANKQNSIHNKNNLVYILWGIKENNIENVIVHLVRQHYIPKLSIRRIEKKLKKKYFLPRVHEVRESDHFTLHCVNTLSEADNGEWVDRAALTTNCEWERKYTQARDKTHRSSDLSKHCRKRTLPQYVLQREKTKIK